jgi:hypothetical protein
MTQVAWAFSVPKKYVISLLSLSRRKWERYKEI